MQAIRERAEFEADDMQTQRSNPTLTLTLTLTVMPGRSPEDASIAFAGSFS